MQRWYCVHTKPRAEAQALEHLQRQGFECLLPRLQRRGAGSLLLETWLAAARARGARSFHVGVNRMSVGALRFWEARGVCGSDFRQGDGKPDLLDGARSR